MTYKTIAFANANISNEIPNEYPCYLIKEASLEQILDIYYIDDNDSLRQDIINELSPEFINLFHKDESYLGVYKKIKMDGFLIWEHMKN